jgi:hypothetical protein
MIEGFGVHSFRLINDAGQSTFVLFHWRPKIGLQSTIWDETIKIAGAYPDFHRRDIQPTGGFPLSRKRSGQLQALLRSCEITMTCGRTICTKII